MGELAGTAATNSLSNSLEDSANKALHALGGDMLRSFENRRTRRYSTEDFPVRSSLEDFIEGSFFKALLSINIIMSLVLLVTETDMRSEQRTAYFETHFNTDGFHFQSSTAFDYCSYAVSAFFLLDLTLRIYVFRKVFWDNFSNIFDFGVVATDLLVLGLTPFQDLPSVSVLRVLRMFRIIRFLRSFLIFRELYLMMQGLATALRSIVFATFLIAIVLILWSILAVEFVHIPNMTLHTGDNVLYEDCPVWLCEAAFANVWFSSLTFLKTIVAGDGWGQLAYPLITQKPTTAFVLLGSLCMIQLGLLNLIVAVIVDRARCARESDEALVSTEKKQQLNASYKKLQGLFCMMDEDGSGALGLDEIHASYFKYAEFREVLDALDVRQKDLDLIFEILDGDKDGMVSYEEFVQTLHEMKEINTSTMLVCIRHSVQKMEKVVSGTQQRLGAYELGMRGLQRYMSAINEKLCSLTEYSKELKEAVAKGVEAPESGAKPEKEQEEGCNSQEVSGPYKTQEVSSEFKVQERKTISSLPTSQWRASPNHLPLKGETGDAADEVTDDSSGSDKQPGTGAQSAKRPEVPAIQAQAVQEAFTAALEVRIEALKPQFAKTLNEAARLIAQGVVQASVSAVDEGLGQVLGDIGGAPFKMRPSQGIKMSWPSEEPLSWDRLQDGPWQYGAPWQDAALGLVSCSTQPHFHRIGSVRRPTRPSQVFLGHGGAPEAPAF